MPAEPASTELHFRTWNLSSLRHKLVKRTTRFNASAAHLLDDLKAAAEAADAAMLEGRSFGVQVRDLWAADGEKGTRAARKLALTDYLKQLRTLGARCTVACALSCFFALERLPLVLFAGTVRFMMKQQVHQWVSAIRNPDFQLSDHRSCMCTHRALLVQASPLHALRCQRPSASPLPGSTRRSSRPCPPQTPPLSL